MIFPSHKPLAIREAEQVGVVPRRFTDNYNQTSSPLMRCAHKESLTKAIRKSLNVSGEICESLCICFCHLKWLKKSRSLWEKEFEVSCNNLWRIF